MSICIISDHIIMLRQNFIIRPLQINFLFPVHRPQLSALNIPLFRILPLFSGYSCILTGSVNAILKQCQLTCQQCYQVGTNFTFLLYLAT